MPQSSQKSTFDTFTHWARSQRDIYICDGITPGMAGEVGKGSGIFARRTIEAGERLVYVPTSALLTTDTVVAAYGGIESYNSSNKVQNSGLPSLSCSAHALLAAYLTRTRNDPELGSWRATWPREEDFKTLPARWSEDLRAMLPGESISLTDRQRCRIQDDWDITKEWISGNTDGNDEDKLKSSFEHHWHIINTRTFYWPHAGSLTKLQEALGPGKASRNDTSINQVEVDSSEGSDMEMEKGTATDSQESKRPSEECLAMCPWADLFNHTDEEFASATFNEHGYTVTALRTYKKNEEIFVNYGSHGNDFLLVEYGFILLSKSDDSHNLDAIILPNLTTEQEEVLKKTGYYGKYILSPKPPYLCFRTHATLRLLATCGENSSIEERYKYENYYSFTDFEESGPPSHGQKVALKALELVLEPLSRNCRRMLDDLEKEGREEGRDECRRGRGRGRGGGRVGRGGGDEQHINNSSLSCDDSHPTNANANANSNSNSNPASAHAVLLTDIQKAMLKTRWLQISHMVATATEAARWEADVDILDSMSDSYLNTGLF